MNAITNTVVGDTNGSVVPGIGTAIGDTIGSVVPGVGTAIGATIGSVVPGVGTVIGSIVGSIVDLITPKKEGISEQAKQINNSFQPLLLQFCNEQNILFPGSVNPSQAVKDFSTVQGISAMTTWMADFRASAMYLKVAPSMPSSWFVAVNKAIQTLPPFPNISTGTATSSLTNITSAISSSLNGLLNYNSNLQPGATNAGMSPIAIFLIIGAIAGLGYMFLKGKK